MARMPRPSRQLDQALLRSGRVLLPEFGCAGLTQRRLAEHAGVQPGMFHYHFASKDAFLQTLLQQLYDEMFDRLSAGVVDAPPGDVAPLLRLRRGLVEIGRFVREHHALLARLVADAIGGVAVVHAFMRANAPRHLGVLMQLLQQAEAEGALTPAPPLQRLAFLMGATVAPMLVAPGIVALGLPLAAAVPAQVLDDAALQQRVDLALCALQPTKESQR